MCKGDSGACGGHLQACLANMARLNECRSLNRSPPSYFGSFISFKPTQVNHVIIILLYMTTIFRSSLIITFWSTYRG